MITISNHNCNTNPQRSSALLQEQTSNIFHVKHTRRSKDNCKTERLALMEPHEILDKVNAKKTKANASWRRAQTDQELRPPCYSCACTQASATSMNAKAFACMLHCTPETNAVTTRTTQLQFKNASAEA